LITLTL